MLDTVGLKTLATEPNENEHLSSKCVILRVAQELTFQDESEK